MVSASSSTAILEGGNVTQKVQSILVSIERIFIRHLATLALIVLLTGCVQTPAYRKTWDQARATSDPQQSRALCEKALNEAEEAGAVCKDDYDYISSYLLQSPLLTADDRTQLLQRSVDCLKNAKCRDVETRRFSRLKNLSEHLCGQKDWEKADVALSETLALGQKIWGPDNRKLAGVRDDAWKNSQFKAITYPSSLYIAVANCKEKLGKFAEAEPMRRKQVELYEKYYSETASISGGKLDSAGLELAKSALANNLANQRNSDSK